MPLVQASSSSAQFFGSVHLFFLCLFHFTHIKNACRLAYIKKKQYLCSDFLKEDGFDCLQPR